MRQTMKVDVYLTIWEYGETRNKEPSRYVRSVLQTRGNTLSFAWHARRSNYLNIAAQTGTWREIGFYLLITPFCVIAFLPLDLCHNHSFSSTLDYQQETMKN